MQTIISTLDEFYAAVDLLIGQLRAAGYADDASRLHTLLHEVAWTTSSELLGELRLVLDSLKGRHTGPLLDQISACRKFTVKHRKILGFS